METHAHTSSNARTMTVAMTGASGAQYGLRLLGALLDLGHRVYLLVSKAGLLVINTETEYHFSGRPQDMQAQMCAHFGVSEDRLIVFGPEQWMAPVASGSSITEAMVICPCTTSTLAQIATGTGHNLILRAADVSLKERKKLILVVRETPFSEIHLNNMLTLSRAGATVLPANPGFYDSPQSLDDIYDFIVGRVLDHLAIPHQIGPRWGQDKA